MMYNGKPFPKITIEINSPLEAQWFDMIAGVDNPLDVFNLSGTTRENNETLLLERKLNTIKTSLQELLGEDYYWSTPLTLDTGALIYSPILSQDQPDQEVIVL